MGPEVVSMALVFAVAFGSALVLTPVAEAIGHRLGSVDRPRPGELQTRPLARTGGYALFLAFVIGVGLSLALFPRSETEQQRLAGLLIGAVLILPLAIADDMRRLSPMPQLIGQLVVAGVAMAMGLLIDNVANPFGGIIPFPLAIALPFTLLWIVGMMNTINLIDNMDGVATGIGGIAAMILFIRSFDLGQYSIAVLPLALAGACCGFLPYNFNPSRIILGSSGPLLLGFSLAGLAIIGGAKIATAALVMALPIIDVVLVIVQRTVRGRSPLQGGDRAHLPHRLVAAGMSQRQVTGLIYAICLLAGWLALYLSSVQKLYLFVGTGLIVVCAAIALAVRVRGTQPDQVAAEKAPTSQH